MLILVQRTIIQIETQKAIKVLEKTFIGICLKFKIFHLIDLKLLNPGMMKLKISQVQTLILSNSSKQLGKFKYFNNLKILFNFYNNLNSLFRLYGLILIKLVVVQLYI